MPREPQFSRLPLIWKKLDKQGLLERFLGVEDTELNRTRQKIEDLLSARDITQIPDRFLKIIGYVVGHRWKDYRSYSWNRQRISELINKYSYKGSDECLSDLVYEYGGNWHEVIDMASLVGAYDRQGSNVQNSHYFNSDYFHPGVYQLWLPDVLDLEHFLEDFEYLKPAGTKWIIRFRVPDCSATISVLDFAIPISIFGATYDYSYKLYNYNYGFYDHIPQIAWEPIVFTTIWSELGAPYSNLYDQAVYTYVPQSPIDPVVYNVIWVELSADSNVYGDSFYNFVLQWSPEPWDYTVYVSLPAVEAYTPYGGIVPELFLTESLAVSNARLDLNTLSFFWNSENIDIFDDFISVDYNWQQPIVEPSFME